MGISNARVQHFRQRGHCSSQSKHTTATMAATRYCPSCLSTASPTTLFRPIRAFAPPPALRSFHTSSPLAAVQSANAAKYKRKDQAQASKKKKKTSSNYDTPDLRDAQQFSLVDAMRYVVKNSPPSGNLSSQVPSVARL